MLARLVNEERTPPTALQVEPEPRLSRSMRTTLPTPASARWNAQLVPMTPPPMMTTSASEGIAFRANVASVIFVVPCREPDGDLALAGQRSGSFAGDRAQERNRFIWTPSILYR